MKHEVTAADLRTLISGASSQGIVITEQQSALLLRHLSRVLELNESVNITRITEWDEALRLHVLDSILCVRELIEAPEGLFIDLGTGAGYPGIPAAIVTGRSGVLLDSVKKKAALVSGLVEELGLADRLAVVSERAEEHALTCANGYQAVLARAVTSLPSLIELASPLLADGGVLIALKARIADDELDSGCAVGRIVGMDQVSLRPATVPFGEEVRTIVTFRKCGSPKITLPRRAGLAQHNPLA